jgi:hypothetical protein
MPSDQLASLSPQDQYVKLLDCADFYVLPDLVVSVSYRDVPAPVSSLCRWHVTLFNPASLK